MCVCTHIVSICPDLGRPLYTVRPRVVGSGGMAFSTAVNRLTRPVLPLYLQTTRGLWWGRETSLANFSTTGPRVGRALFSNETTSEVVYVLAAMFDNKVNAYVYRRHIRVYAIYSMVVI